MTFEMSKERLQQVVDGDIFYTDEQRAVARALLAAYEQEPVAYAVFANNGNIRIWSTDKAVCDGIGDTTPLYTHPAPSIPAAEHQRVIEMLLSVCGAAFELADDSCEQEVEGETCTVVPSDAFQKLSDALDEIENTLPAEDADRPDVCLVWAAMPRAALKQLLHTAPSIPVVPDEKHSERFDWTFGDWANHLGGRHQNNDPANYYEFGSFMAVAEMLRQFGKVQQKVGWNECRASMLQAEPVKPVIPAGYMLVPVEPTENMVIEGFESAPDRFFSEPEVWEAYQAMSGCEQAAHRARLCWAAMLAAVPKEA